MCCCLLLADQVSQINLSAIIGEFFKFLGAWILFKRARLYARAFFIHNLAASRHALIDGRISNAMITSRALALM